MATTWIQQPNNKPQAAYTRLLWVASGSVYTDQPLFQYVCDVYVYDEDYPAGERLVKRMTQPINPAGTATFDVARLIQGELSADYNWKINTPTVYNELSSSRSFKISAGEQFGTSISSSVTVYPDQDFGFHTPNQAVVEPNAGTYDFTPTKKVLSNMPATMSMQSDDYGTFMVVPESITSPGPTEAFISQSFYSASSITGTYSLVDETNFTIGKGIYSTIPISSSANYWNYVDVSISSSYGTETYRYEASDETHREKTRFAFVNKLGAWDYYNNYNPVRQRIEVSREQYTAARVDYSSRLSTYDISRRGRNDYHNSTDDQFTVDTDLLDKTNANWLEELIESPEVYIQRNGEFIPIVITDSSYVANQNQARQKQFKYTINFKPSNQPFGTWIPEYVQCPKKLGNIFDPYDNNSIPSSSLLYWYDFSDTGSMTLSGSKYLTEIESKGFYSMSLTTGSITKYSTNWIAPEVKNGYTSFFGTTTNNSSLNRNSALSSIYGNSPSLQAGFKVTDTHTIIMFDKPTFPDSNGTLNSNIEFSNNSGGSDVFESYKILSTRKSQTDNDCNSIGRTPSASFYSATESFMSSSGTEILQVSGGGTSNPAATYYSYSGSISNWESKYIKYDGSSFPASILSSSRTPNERIASQSFEPYTRTGFYFYENLVVGGFAKDSCTGGSPFDLAHFLMYTGSLTNGQITNIINSFKGPVPPGSQVNSISN